MDQQNQTVNIAPQQVSQAALTFLELLDLETTILPTKFRKQISVLEIILQNVATGAAVVVSPDKLQVQSKPEDPRKPPEERPSGDADKAKTETGGDPAEPSLPEADAGVQPPTGTGRGDQSQS